MLVQNNLFEMIAQWHLPHLKKKKYTSKSLHVTVGISIASVSVQTNKNKNWPKKCGSVEAKNALCGGFVF